MFTWNRDFFQYMTLPCRTLGVALVELSGWLLIFSTWFTSFTVLFPFSLLIAIFFIASLSTGKFSQLNTLLMNLSLETLNLRLTDWLTYSGGTDRLQIIVLTQFPDCDDCSLASVDIFLVSVDMFHLRLCCTLDLPVLRNHGHSYFNYLFNSLF